MSLGYSVFVFTNEGDCVVTKSLVQVYRIVYSRTTKISTWLQLFVCIARGVWGHAPPPHGNFPI